MDPRNKSGDDIGINRTPPLIPRHKGEREEDSRSIMPRYRTAPLRRSFGKSVIAASTGWRRCQSLRSSFSPE